MTTQKKNNIGKILGILLIICVMVLGLFFVFKNKSIKNDDEFNEAISRLAKTQNTSNDTKYATKTLIVKSNNDINVDNAEKVVKYEDTYVLTYKTEKEAEEAYNTYAKNDSIEYVDVDAVMEVQENDVDETNIEVSKEEIEEFLETCSYNDEKDADILDNYDITNPFGYDKVEGNTLDSYLDGKTQTNEVKVAIIDSGIDKSKFDSERIIDLGINYSTSGKENDITDDNGHGTEMAKIIADQTGSNVKLMPIKVVNKDGKASILTAYIGIKAAIENNADIINISLNTMTSSNAKILEEVINEAVEKGIMVVVSAGNNSDNVKYYTPANIEKVFTISATDTKGTFAGYSNYGEYIDYASCGSYDFDGTEKTGTSMAAANFSANIANILGTKTMNMNELVSILDKCINEGNAVERNDYIGKGYIGKISEIDKNKVEEGRIIGIVPSLTDARNLEDGSWKTMSDEELDEYFGNSNDLYIGAFLSTLSVDELKEILNRNTILNSISTTYHSTGEVTEEENWKRILNLYNNSINELTVSGTISTVGSNKVRVGLLSTEETGNDGHKKKYHELSIGLATGINIADQHSYSITSTVGGHATPVSLSNAADKWYALNASGSKATEKVGNKTEYVPRLLMDSNKDQYTVVYIYFTFSVNPYYKVDDYSVEKQGSSARFNFRTYNKANNNPQDITRAWKKDTHSESLKAQINISTFGYNYTHLGSPAADKTTPYLYAHVFRPDKTVKVEGKTGVNTVTGSGTYDCGNSVTMSAKLNTGYKTLAFSPALNLTYNSTTQTYSYTIEHITNDLKYEVSATPISYTVNYYPNLGGRHSDGDTNVVSQGCTYDKTETYKSNDTFSAYWIVSFNANGGTVTTTSKKVASILANWGYGRACGTDFSNLTTEDGKIINVDAGWYNTTIKDLPNPTKTGYDCTGWYTAATGGNQISTATVPTADTTYYAQWKPHISTITLDDQLPNYDTNWGKSSPNPIYVKYDTGWYNNSACTSVYKITSITAPKRTGYVFDGYYTGTGGTGDKVIDANGNICSTIGNKSNVQYYTSNATIYAKWTPIKYKIKYVNTAGTGKHESLKHSDYLNKMSEQEFTFDKAQNLLPNQYIRVCQVDYDPNGGSVTVTNNNTVAEYDFKGWSDQNPDTNTTNTFSYHGTNYKNTAFSGTYYVSHYADLKNAFGYDKFALLRHYLSNGKTEGRTVVGEDIGCPDKAEIKNFSSTQGQVITLDAIWTPNSVVLPKPTRPNSASGTEYEFMGWFEVQYDQNTGYKYEKFIGTGGDRYIPEKDTKLFAKWKEINPGHDSSLFEAEPNTKISVKAEWENLSSDNATVDYDIYKGNTIPEADKVDVNGIAKVVVTVDIQNTNYNGKNVAGDNETFTATAINNKIIETIDTNKWTYLSSKGITVSNGDCKISGNVITWEPKNNVTGTHTMTYYVQLKEAYWDVADKTLYDIESKKTVWTYDIGELDNQINNQKINGMYGDTRTNYHNPVKLQMRPVKWNPNKEYISPISISSNNSNTTGKAWNFYQKKDATNTYYIKYNTKAGEAKSQFKLSFFSVLKRARAGYQVNDMYFDSHYSIGAKSEMYDYYTKNTSGSYSWNKESLGTNVNYSATNIASHTGIKAALLKFVKVDVNRTNDTSGLAVNSADARTKMIATQTNTVVNGDNGARIDVYPQVKINGEQGVVTSDTDVSNKKISLIVDAKDPTLTYVPNGEITYDDVTNPFIDINLNSSFASESPKTLQFNFNDDVSGISNPGRYSDDWITNSNQNIQVRLERLGYKEDRSIINYATYSGLSSSEKAKVYNDPILIYDNKANITNDIVTINYNTTGTGGNFKVKLDPNNPDVLGHLRLTVRVIDNVGNYLNKTYDLYVLSVTGKVSISPYLPRYKDALRFNTTNVFKSGEAGELSIRAKGYVDRITTYFGDELTTLAEEEASLHNIFSSDHYHMNGNYPSDNDSRYGTLPAKYQKVTWGYEETELGGLPIKLSQQYTNAVTVTSDYINNNLDALLNENVITVPAKYEGSSLVQSSYTIAFSSEVNSKGLPKYVVVNGKAKAELSWTTENNRNKVSFDTIVTTTTDWTKVGNEKLRPMVHSFYMPVSAKKGEYRVNVSAYKDGHKVTINVPVKVDGAILNEIRTRIRDN